MAEQLELFVRLKADGSGLVGEVKVSEKELQKLGKTVDDTTKKSAKADKSADKLKDTFRDLGRTSALITGPLGGIASRIQIIGDLMTSTAGAAGLLIAGAGGLGFAFTRFAWSGDAAERQARKMDQVLRTTGFAAGVTRQEIERLARDIGRGTLASTQEVRDAAAQLLTFRSVAGSAFERTLRAAQDLAALGFGTLTSSTLQLAKALESPEQNLAQLNRAGISFNQTQIATIKHLVQTGEQGKALSMILDTIEGQVGGAARADAEGTLAGGFDTLGEELKLFAEAAGTAASKSETLKSEIDGLSSSIRSMTEDVEGRGLAPMLSQMFDQPFAMSRRLAGLPPSGEPTDSRARLEENRRLVEIAMKSRAELANQAAESARRERAELERLRKFQKESFDHTVLVLAEEQRAEQEKREALEKTRTARASIISQLEIEINTFGKSRGQIAAYKLELLGASEGQQQLAKRLGDTVEQLEAQRKAEEKLKAQRKAEEKLEATRKKLLEDRLNAFSRSLQSAVEAENRRHQESLRLLDEAQRQGLRTIFSHQALRERAEQEHQRRLIEIEDSRIEKLERGTIDSTERMRDAARDLGFTFQSAFEDAIVEGKRFSDVLKGLAQDIQRIALRKTVTEPLGGFLASSLGNILSAGAGGSELGFIDTGLSALGGIGAGGSVASSVSAFAFHRGGIAGEAAPRRAVNVDVFAGARRFHRGGLAGDEVPAILRRREEVLTTSDPRHRDNAGGGLKIVINNNVDARGADAGVDAKIRAAMKETSDITVQRIREERRAGGPLSRM